MKFYNFLLILSFEIIISSKNVISLKKHFDVGEPLFLTPYIEKGNISLARSKSEVYLKDFPKIKSYAGYLTVNRNDCVSNLHFWFFPAKNNYPKAPLILWIQGGPGASFLYAVFQENGPMKVINGIPSMRDYYLSIDQSVLYIETPVGTGYSFTDSDSCYVREEEEIAYDLYGALRQFFRLFSELKSNDFIVIGESYAGKFVTAISYKIHKMNQKINPKDKINLKSLALGSGYVVPKYQLGFSDLYYPLGLIDEIVQKRMEAIETRVIELINQKNWKDGIEVATQLLSPEIYGKYIDLPSTFNFLQSQPDNDNDTTIYCQKNHFRASIHVGNVTFKIDDKVANIMLEDNLKPVDSWLIELLSNYRVLFYNGQLDLTCPYLFTKKVLLNLNFSAQDEYLKAERHIWRINNVIAGYIKEAGNLTEILMRNAGHLPAREQPQWNYEMISKFIRNQSLY